MTVIELPSASGSDASRPLAPRAPDRAAAPAQARIAYQPALDGIRAVALLGVVGYHAGIPWLQGGFLGVSAFFTLSGFLITSLLVGERATTGRIALGAFWSRRVRRLLPAALLTIVATVALAAAIGDDSQLARLRLDSLASLFHFSNWRFIAGGDSYGALFESPSFFRHFWSLAVEEQFYLVFPVLVAGGLRLTRGPGRAFTAAVAAVAAVGLVWPALLSAAGASTDRLYFGTDTRLGELALGALLALWWVNRGCRVPDRRAPLALGVGGAVVAVVVLGGMWATAHPGDVSLYRGGLALHALLTSTVIVAAVAPRGPVRAALAWEPLRRLGVISYGAYLFHWPILLWLQQETALGPEARFGLGLAATVVLAAVSHRFLEQPVRRGAWFAPSRRVALAVPASLTVAALVVAVTVVRRPADPPIDFAAAQTELDALVTSSAPAEPAPPVDVPAAAAAGSDADRDDPVAAAAGPVRVSGFGDSTSLMTGLGMARWGQAHPERLTPVIGTAKLGCGVLTGGIRRLEGRLVPVPADCDGWQAEWEAAVTGSDVDVAWIQLGAWDIVDHQLEPGGPFLAIGRDPAYEELLRNGLEDAIDLLLAHTDMVVLVAHPDIGRGRLDTVPAGTHYPEYDPTRAERWRAIVGEIASNRDDVAVVDLAAWVAAQPDDLRLRPDGVHFSPDAALDVADWLAPQILDVYDEWRSGAD